MKQEVNSNISKSVIQLTSSVSQISSHCSPRHFQRRPKKPERLEKFKDNCSKENISYISPKRIRFGNELIKSTIINNNQSSKPRQTLQPKKTNQIQIKTNQLTNEIMNYSQTMSKKMNQQIIKSHSYHSFKDVENQCINVKQIPKQNINDLQQKIATLQRQNKKHLIQKKKNHKIRQQIQQENQNLKNVNEMQQKQITRLTTQKKDIQELLQSVKIQNENNQEQIRQLNNKVKRMIARPALKRLQSDITSLSTPHQTQFLQQTISKLRQQLFQSNKKIKYQEVQIITLKRKNSEMQSKNKMISVLTCEKSKLQRKVELLSKKQKDSKQRSKYIESKDHLVIIELSPQKQQ